MMGLFINNFYLIEDKIMLYSKIQYFLEFVIRKNFNRISKKIKLIIRCKIFISHVLYYHCSLNGHTPKGSDNLKDNKSYNIKSN